MLERVLNTLFSEREVDWSSMYRRWWWKAEKVTPLVRERSSQSRTHSMGVWVCPVYIAGLSNIPLADITP